MYFWSMSIQQNEDVLEMTNQADEVEFYMTMFQCVDSIMETIQDGLIIHLLRDDKRKFAAIGITGIEVDLVEDAIRIEGPSLQWEHESFRARMLRRSEMNLLETLKEELVGECTAETIVE